MNMRDYFSCALQRTWIALLEKKIPFTYHEVSLRNPKTGLWFPLTEKPKWFTDLNPLGKVGHNAVQALPEPSHILAIRLYRQSKPSDPCSTEVAVVLMQVPTLAYVSECEPEVQTVYESLICNEFLEVRRKASVHCLDEHETAQWSCMLGTRQGVGLPEVGMHSGTFPERDRGSSQHGHARTAPVGPYIPEQCLCLKDLATSEEHPALLPPHPAVRARARIIMDHFNTHFVPLFYRILVR